MIVSQLISFQHNNKGNTMQKKLGESGSTMNSAARKRVSFAEQLSPELSLLDATSSEGRFVLFI